MTFCTLLEKRRPKSKRGLLLMFSIIDFNTVIRRYVHVHRQFMSFYFVAMT